MTAIFVFIAGLIIGFGLGIFVSALVFILKDKLYKPDDGAWVGYEQGQ